SLLWMVLELGVFAIAAFVYWMRPTDRPTRQFFLMTVVVIHAFLGGCYWSQLVTQPALLIVFMVCAVLLPAVSLHFFQLFPHPKPWLEARPVRTLLLTYGPSVVALAVIGGGYGTIRYLTRSGAADADVQAALDLVRRIVYAYLGVAAVLYLACVLC